MSMFTDMTGFLGWCTLINLVVFCLAAFVVTAMRGTVLAIHRKMFGLSDKELKFLYMQYLGNYKLLILVFNLVPYLALRLAG